MSISSLVPSSAGAWATAGAAAAGAGGMGLFSYNRGNYKFDQKMHYTRFNAGVAQSIAQTGMYREDIKCMTELTGARMDVYHGLAGMIATILTALFCPGRLGLHTPPPPGWLMGLFMTNLAGCYLWLGLTMWLAMHASLRSQAASTHMLTRFVRLPIPNMAMLDRARKFMSSFEEQPLEEIFRVPFLGHSRRKSAAEPRRKEADPALAGDSADRHIRKDKPFWYRKEMDNDYLFPAETIEGTLPAGAMSEQVPEHFRIYKEIQNEWWPYDVYSRICIMLAMLHLTHAWSYHQIGHALTETRAVFAPGCIVLSLFVVQQAILTLDIVPQNDIPWHRIGPFAQWLGYIAGALEYKRWYTPAGMVWTTILVYLAHFIHIAYTYQLYRLCAPSMSAPEVADVTAAAWWPKSWSIPNSFSHAIWLVAPPRSLTEGQHDLVGEMKAKKGGSDAKATRLQEKRQDVHRFLGDSGESPAWFNVKIGLIAMLAAWVWMVLGYSVEVANQGTMHPSLISAPGMPHNSRDPRYRPAKPGPPVEGEKVEVGTGGELASPNTGVYNLEFPVWQNRRLKEVLPEIGLHDLAKASDLTPDMRTIIADRVRAVLPFLKELASGGTGAAFTDGMLGAAAVPPVMPPPASLVAVPARAEVSWPPLFEPRLLACGPHHMDGFSTLALSRHGRGTLVTRNQAQPAAEATPFILEGAASFGPLLAAAWDEAGLLLAAATGATLECPGRFPAGGRWKCQPHNGGRLPLGLGGKPFNGAVALARHPQDPTTLRAAITSAGDSFVTVYARAGHAGAPWLPAGEARARMPAKAASFAPTGDSLFLTAEDGSVTHMKMGEGTLSQVAAAVPEHSGHSWQASCGLRDGGLARLALTPLGASAWEPTLLLG